MGPRIRRRARRRRTRPSLAPCPSAQAVGREGTGRDLGVEFAAPYPCRDQERGLTLAEAGPRQRRATPPRGDIMPTVIGHHDVKDTDHWLASPKREEVFGPLGVTNIRTFVNPQNRSQVAVLMDVADLDVVMAAMQNPAMADAMEFDGVLPETLVILVEA